MIGILAMAAVSLFAMDVRVGQTPGGPRMFVDGKVVRPRFYYGSPTCLCNISGRQKTVLKIPFAADRDTANGRVALDGYPGVDPLWFSDAKLIDLTAGTTNVVLSAGDETNTLHFVAGGLTFAKGHRYHFAVTHRATRPRTYFTIEVSYCEDGTATKLPYYYGDTLGDTVALAAAADVDLVTFSTDSSWGCEGWWNPPEAPEDYSKIDREFERLVGINPNALLVPRITTDAPAWLHERHPEIKMVYEPRCGLVMSSVSSRIYRKAACDAVERLSRHLKAKFPRHYAGLQISGQNSAEWFYMLSGSSGDYLSGYDAGTRDAFREWLKVRGDIGWATAEVPPPAERSRSPLPPRALEFARFRQREMASFLVELGAAAKRGSRGEALTLFFYGYAWELGGKHAPETGHFDFAWLMKNAKGRIDGFSSPLSYHSRNLTGSTAMMSAAESVTRNGYLWFNEIDHRTHHEEMWDHMALFTPYADPRVTREMLLRDSAADILRGYGDWWMDLFGRGWYRDADIWKLRGELNRIDDLVARRKRPYSPQIASVVHEDSFLCGGSDGLRRKLLVRTGFATCGTDYGQYLLADVLENPPESVKLFYFPVIRDLAPDLRAKLDALKASRPDATFVEDVTPQDVTAEAIADRARKAGVHCFTAPGEANVCSSEGIVLVQALRAGMLAIDFGSDGAVRDALSGKFVCVGPKAELPFRLGETRLFMIAPPAASKSVGAQIRLEKPAMRWLWGGFGFHNSEATMTPLMTDEFRDQRVLKSFREISPTFSRLFAGYADWTREAMDRFADYYDATFRRAGTTLYLVPGRMPTITEDFDADDYAEAVATRLEYLVKERKCTKIRYYTASNELSVGPSGAWFKTHWDKYVVVMDALYRAFQRHGLDIGLMSSDASSYASLDTIDWAIRDLNEVTDTYCWHIYSYSRPAGKKGRLAPGDPEFYGELYEALTNYVRRCMAKDKRLSLGEWGVSAEKEWNGWQRMRNDGGTGFNNPGTVANLAAMTRVEMGLCAMNAGCVNAASWTFCDYPDPFIREDGDTAEEKARYDVARFSGYGVDVRYNKWGLFRWDVEARDYSSYPDLYAMGYLAKLFRKGARVLQASSDDATLRVGAVTNPDGSCSIAVINWGGCKDCRILSEHTISCPMRRYVYESANPPFNAFNDLQRASGTVTADGGTVAVELPEKSITYLTTDYRDRTPPRIDGVNVENGVLAWKAVEDGDHVYYRVYRDGVQIASTVATSLNVGDTKGVYAVTSIDRWGNEGNKRLRP